MGGTKQHLFWTELIRYNQPNKRVLHALSPASVSLAVQI
jgi:hypothetical protein